MRQNHIENSIILQRIQYPNEKPAIGRFSSLIRLL